MAAIRVRRQVRGRTTESAGSGVVLTAIGARMEITVLRNGALVDVVAVPSELTL